MWHMLEAHLSINFKKTSPQGAGIIDGPDNSIHLLHAQLLSPLLRRVLEICLETSHTPRGLVPLTSLSVEPPRHLPKSPRAWYFMFASIKENTPSTLARKTKAKRRKKSSCVVEKKAAAGGSVIAPWI